MEENPEFFYDKDPSNPFFTLWAKSAQLIPKDIEKQPLAAKGVLFKKGKKLKLTKTRFYFISGGYLCYKEREEAKKVKGILQFSNVHYSVKVDQVTGKAPKTVYYLRLQRNTFKTKLFTFEKQTFELFNEALCCRCIMDCFQRDYKLIKMIGKGSFAKVYLAQNLKNKDFYAVKAFYKDQVLAQSSGREALLNEIEIMRKLAGNHSLLNLYEVYESKNSIYLVVDLLEGGELLQDLKPEHPYKESRVCRLLQAVLEALAIVHRNNIIHRDLKPENILLRSSSSPFEIVIADFGLATPMHSDLKQIVFKRCGTPGYVAPEVLMFKEGQAFYDATSDIFSVGVIFYIMVSMGTRPFKGSDAHETLMINKKAQPNYSRPGMEKLSPQGLDLMKKMMHINPKQRLTAKEALEHAFFKMGEKEHDKNYQEDTSSLSNAGNLLYLIKHAGPEERKSEENIKELAGLKVDSTQKLLNSPSNNFEYRNNGLNGRVDTIVDSTKLSSFKCEDDGSSKNAPLSPKPLNSANSRFSRIGGGGSQSPEKNELNFDGIVRRSDGNIKAREEEGRKNRSSLSPTHKKQNRSNEIYKLAIMNQKKKNENGGFYN